MRDFRSGQAHRRQREEAENEGYSGVVKIQPHVARILQMYETASKLAADVESSMEQTFKKLSGHTIH